jgi:membrane-associated protease RseP (regulator of RpoE activity)
MGDEMWKNMLGAQATWDATMGYNAVEALKQHGDPKAIMVVLVGSGHVAYGLGIERQAKKWFDGPIASIIPVSVGTPARGIEKDTQASYANFTWGIAHEADTTYPMMGASMAVGQGEAGRRVIIVQEGSPAARAGVKVGDILQSLDGVALADKETYNRVIAAKRWGDAAPLVVKRGTETVTLTVVFRRQLREK